MLGKEKVVKAVGIPGTYCDVYGGIRLPEVCS